MPSLSVVISHDCSLWAQVLAYSGSAAIARLLRSAALVQGQSLPALPAVIGERSGGSGRLAAAHCREMGYDAVVQEVEAISDRAELDELRARLAESDGDRVLGFFDLSRGTPDISCIRRAADSGIPVETVVVADHQGDVRRLPVSADELGALLREGESGGQGISERLGGPPGYKVLGAARSQSLILRSCWGFQTAWSDCLVPVWSLDQLEALALPAVVVTGSSGGDLTENSVTVDDYESIWSTEEDRQRAALARISSRMQGNIDGICLKAEVLASTGVLGRVLGLLKNPSLQRDVLRALHTMSRGGLCDHSFVAAPLRRHAPLFVDCLRSPNVQVRRLAVQVFANAGASWLSGIRQDSAAVLPLFRAILQQLLQESARGDMTKRAHPARAAIRALLQLCEDDDDSRCLQEIIAGGLQCCSASCARAIAAAIKREVGDAGGAGDWRVSPSRGVGTEVLALSDAVLSTAEGMEAVASTPPRPPPVLQRRACGESPSAEIAAVRPRQPAQSHREAVLEAGTSDMLHNQLAWISDPAPAFEGLMEMSSYAGAAVAVQRFSPGRPRGFLRAVPDDQEETIAAEPGRSYEASGDSEGLLPSDDDDVWFDPLDWGWDPKPAIEGFVAGLTAMSSYVGAAISVQRFSPGQPRGSRRVVPTDQVGTIAREGVWSYGAPGGSAG